MSQDKAYEHIKHEIAPVFDEHSRILILGTLPSAASREKKFFYGHPQNRFWKVLAKVMKEEKVPMTIEEKTSFLLRNHIALWDVIDECDIIGASDSTIKNVVPSDINRILKQTAIKKLYANGSTAYRLYMKYTYPITKMEIEKLPSTSPANAAFGMDRLVEIWGKALLSFS